MRLGIIADIHANAPALRATLRALEAAGAERVLALGDLVGYNAMPHETLQLLRDHHIPSVHGNHDLMAIGHLPADQCGPRARQAIAWTARRLTGEEAAQLALLPETFRLGKRLLCLHAGLGDPLRRLRSVEEVRGEAARVQQQEPGVTLCLVGHEHRQFIHFAHHPPINVDQLEGEFPLPKDELAFVNPGTVGEPRNRDPRAEFAIFDSQRWTLTFRRIDYDRKPIVEANRRAGFLERRRQEDEYGLFGGIRRMLHHGQRVLAQVTG